MKESHLYFGDKLLNLNDSEVSFNTIQMKGETFFKIENYHEMPPFFMTIVSDVDFWLFVSSTGGLTAGRKTPENALFPYITDDKIHDSCETTGPQTILLVSDGEKNSLWKPFSNHQPNIYNITRNLYKNTIGNKIVFEEINRDLKLTYRYTWKTSNVYGFIKASELMNDSDKTIKVTILDGMRNLMPYGVDAMLQTSRSTLVDGYKRSELIEKAGLGIFTLSSIISDRAEPSESLKATTVWSIGFDHPKYLLSEQQVKAFEKNKRIETEHDIKGRRGAFYVSAEVFLKGAEVQTWSMVAELNQNASKIEALMDALKNPSAVAKELDADVLKGDENLKKLVYAADGFQLTESKNIVYRHFSNTLYNIMRGGIYADGYTIDVQDLIHFIQMWNKDVFDRHSSLLKSFSNQMNYFDILEKIETVGDLDLTRLLSEYLPLTYSRRHGDPSRPWNKFNIEVFKEDGTRNLNFEGNWRDIFQNWEALSLSYPGYIESIIAKFVNASTADGYNPYRITKEGVDWEKLDPADPWSNIGYWGDHQVIYLLKLMELSQKYHPEKLHELLEKNTFVYANVPYRVKGFDDILLDPRNTIVFDDALELKIEERVSRLGADGKLISLGDDIYHVNLMEKLLVVLLSKLSNYIPKGGIWLNTQRPEWNDANNALVGNGVSMVTLYYLHRYLNFISELIGDYHTEVMISHEVKVMFDGILNVLESGLKDLGDAMNDEKRYEIVTQLGRIGETYRNQIYTHAFSGQKSKLSYDSIRNMLTITTKHLKDTIDANRRPDGLYHAYNLVKFGQKSCSISYLYEMLEGQVAVLSSGALSSKEAVEVLFALRHSAIYRADQNSYMLYPVRELPKFLEKNIVPEALVKASKVLTAEIEKGHTRFIERDIHGQYHFNGQFRNASEIVSAILQSGEYSKEDALLVGESFTDLFDHHSFTGRSGTFYKYEGLGCIYWHMVSKLVLAAQESYKSALNHGDLIEADLLSEYFHELKLGVGAEKSPVEYGAFPTDAYSHTPGFAGVQQPGMTGQVKEDFISRIGELGVDVIGGEVYFAPTLLSKSEFLKQPTVWTLPDRTIELEEKQLGFTVCSVPVIYEMNNFQAITVCYHNGDKYTFENTQKLNKEISHSLFNREGKIERIVVKINI